MRGFERRPEERAQVLCCDSEAAMDLMEALAMDGMAGELLTSPQNSYVKELVRLRKDGNARKEVGCFLMEGRKAVQAALEQRRTEVPEVILCERMLEDEGAWVRRARDREARIVRVSKDVFKKIADVITPQGIAAVVRIPVWNWEEILERPRALLLVACGIQDPGNLGTLIRSCEAAGAAGLIALEGSVDPFNSKVVRSTAGGLLTLPILRMRMGEFCERVRAQQAANRAAPLRLVASAATGGSNFHGFAWQARPLALCIGSEGSGLPEQVRALCGETVTIPIRGSSESLNAAVASSILLFEAQAAELGGPA